MQVKRKADDQPGFQLAPMIDMTFLLLIFFMVTTKITEEQKKLTIKLPIAMSAVQPDHYKGREIINIDDRGLVYVGERQMDEKELAAFLKQRLIDHPPLRIYIRADAQTPGRTINRIVKLCSEAGAIELLFGTHRK